MANLSLSARKMLAVLLAAVCLSHVANAQLQGLQLPETIASLGVLTSGLFSGLSGALGPLLGQRQQPVLPNVLQSLPASGLSDQLTSDDISQDPIRQQQDPVYWPKMPVAPAWNDFGRRRRNPYYMSEDQYGRQQRQQPAYNQDDRYLTQPQPQPQQQQQQRPQQLRRPQPTNNGLLQQQLPLPVSNLLQAPLLNPSSADANSEPLLVSSDANNSNKNRARKRAWMRA